MSNVPPWMSKWARSPRQDRRVVENGKFVELGQVQLPEPPPVEEQEVNTALEVVHEPAVEQERSTGTDVLPDTQEGSSSTGLESGNESVVGNSPASVGATEEVSNPTVSTTEGPSVSEASQAELEPLDAVAEHEKGSQTVAQIVEALEPLPGSVYEEGETRDYSDFIKKSDDIPF